MDIVLDEDGEGANYLEYLAIGGVLDFYFLAGPSPTEVSRQYAEVVGTPALVPYWSLGVRYDSSRQAKVSLTSRGANILVQFHQCKYGYRDWFEVAEVVHNYSAAGIPLEYVRHAQAGDVYRWLIMIQDHMDRY